MDRPFLYYLHPRLRGGPLPNYKLTKGHIAGGGEVRRQSVMRFEELDLLQYEIGQHHGGDKSLAASSTIPFNSFSSISVAINWAEQQ